MMFASHPIPSGSRHSHLDLYQNVIQDVSRFELRAHNLIVETAAWEDGSSPCAIGTLADKLKIRLLSC
eukprot:1150478-Pelagomonas_calceolata.AAC.7